MNLTTSQVQVMMGAMTLASGEKVPAFLRFRSKPQEKERVALQLLAAHHVPAPVFLGLLEMREGTILVQSFVEGVDLAAVLPISEEQARPPLPVSPMTRTPCSPSQLATAILHLVKSVAQMHRIRRPRFGHLVTDDPNPHRTNAQLFTLQEAQVALDRCRTLGWLTDQDHDQLSHWLREQCQAYIDADEAPVLIHADLHPANIRLARQDDGTWAFTGLIDIEHAKAWLPEYDLALLRWHLGDTLWTTFLQGYQYPLSEARLQLFDMIKLLMIMSVRPREDGSEYSVWAHTTLRRFLTLPSFEKGDLYS